MIEQDAFDRRKNLREQGHVGMLSRAQRKDCAEIEAIGRAHTGAQLAPAAGDHVPDGSAGIGLGLIYEVGAPFFAAFFRVRFTPADAVRLADRLAVSGPGISPAEVPFGKGDDTFFSSSFITKGRT